MYLGFYRGMYKKSGTDFLRQWFLKLNQVTSRGFLNYTLNELESLGNEA